MFGSLLTAIGFLSVLPVPYRAVGPGGLGRAAIWFPAVGLIIGGVLVGVDFAGRALWNAQVAAALMLGASLLLTGGLHVDGWMDTADAFFSHKSPERMLEIMRDSRSGALGVAAGVVMLLTKFAAFAHLAGAEQWRVILLVPVLGRLSMVIAVAFFPGARASGLGTSFSTETGARQALLASALGAVLAGAVLGWHGLVLAAGAPAMAVLSGAYWQRRIGGLTGDIYGATNEATEVAVLLAASAWMMR